MEPASKKLDEVIHGIAFQEITKDAATGFEPEPLLDRLKSLGSELWIDTGDLELARSVWKRELSALTTNNTLANQVVQSGVMDEVIQDTVRKIRQAGADLPEDELVIEIGFVINCRIALRLVNAFGVKVSVELHPSVARDIEKSLSFAHRYHKVCPEYFNIKLPLTPEGYLAVRKLRREGIPINFTLGFSARQNYLAARLSDPNYCNVFLGRLNAVVSGNSLGTGKYVGEKVTLATQRALLKLREAGRTHTKLIAASIRSGDQLATLAGVDVHTIPPKALKEFLASGLAPEELRRDFDRDLETGIDTWNSMSSRLPQLWELPDHFETFVDELLVQPGLDGFSGEDLVEFCERQGIDLFYRFTGEDKKRIYDHGKIPKLGDWPGKAAVDDLMTQSALQSFARDQDALDQRIRSFLS